MDRAKAERVLRDHVVGLRSPANMLGRTQEACAREHQRADAIEWLLAEGTTGAAAASAAGRVLHDPSSTPDEKAAAASALAGVPRESVTVTPMIGEPYDIAGGGGGGGGVQIDVTFPPGELVRENEWLPPGYAERLTLAAPDQPPAPILSRVLTVLDTKVTEARERLGDRTFTNTDERRGVQERLEALQEVREGIFGGRLP